MLTDVGGRIEGQARARRALFMVIAITLVLILLYVALGWWLETALTLATLPIALIGGVLALWSSGETWNVSSFVGLIGLFGIAVQNSLVLVSQTGDLIRSGMPFQAAIRKARVGRVSPKPMTAATAIPGLLPLILLPGGGSEIERRLAVVMFGGRVTSSLFTLLPLPAFITRIERRRPGYLLERDP